MNEVNDVAVYLMSLGAGEYRGDTYRDYIHRLRFYEFADGAFPTVKLWRQLHDDLATADTHWHRLISALNVCTSFETRQLIEARAIEVSGNISLFSAALGGWQIE